MAMPTIDGDQGQGRVAAVGQHLVDHRHHQERREDGQDAERERSEADLAQRALLLHHQAEQPAQRERRVGLGVAAAGAQQHRLAGPDLGSAAVRPPAPADRPRDRVGSLTKTTLCSVLTPVSRPAVPSVNSSTTGPVLWNRIRWRQRSRTARDHMPAFCAQVDSDAADGDVVARPCRGIRSDRVPARGSGRRRSWPAGADGSAALRRSPELDRRAGVRAATRVGYRLRPLPRRTGDVSVIYIHEQSPSEACPIHGRFSCACRTASAALKPGGSADYPFVGGRNAVGKYAPSSVQFANKSLRRGIDDPAGTA